MSIQFHLGDCLEVLRGLPEGCVDLVLADPPYGTTRAEWVKPLPFDKLWPELMRVCRGAIVLFSQSPFDKTLACSNLKYFRYEWIWEKCNATGHLNSARAPMKAHENILVFYVASSTYNPVKTQGHERRKSRAGRPAGGPLYGKYVASAYDSDERFPRSVLKFTSDKQRRQGVNATRKPIALLEYMIATYTNKGDTVLDFCMGSGSAAVAAKRQGRSFIGIDISVEMVAGARALVEKEGLI